MPLGLAVLLWAADVVPVRPIATVRTMTLSAAELARTSSVMNGAPASVVQSEPVPAPPREALRLGEAPADLAVLIGSRRAGGQIEMGALGGGRADAPGLIHIGLGLDF